MTLLKVASLSLDFFTGIVIVERRNYMAFKVFGLSGSQPFSFLTLEWLYNLKVTKEPGEFVLCFDL